MLKRLHLKNFTVFADADFEFSPGLNVLVGTNGTGKSHVLKAGYAMHYNLLEQIEELTEGVTLSEIAMRGYHAKSDEKIKNVFQPLPFESETLIRRSIPVVEASLLLEVESAGNKVDNYCVFSHFQKNEPSLNWRSENEINQRFAVPVFIPAKEVLTLGWMLSIYDSRRIPLDETYPDLLRLLSLPPLRAPEIKAQEALSQLQNVIGGKVDEATGRFYLNTSGQQGLEMNLVAEGLRKFATIYKLLVNGVVTPETTLFWDEPEANLNPALLRKLAAILAELARQGFQIILATHSTDLLKEFHILSRQKDAPPLPIKYFGLNAEPGEATRIVSTDNFEFLPDVVALAEELKQADELEEIFIREDREYYANNRGEEPGV